MELQATVKQLKDGYYIIQENIKEFFFRLMLTFWLIPLFIFKFFRFCMIWFRISCSSDIGLILLEISESLKVCSSANSALVVPKNNNYHLKPITFSGSY